MDLPTSKPDERGRDGGVREELAAGGMQLKPSTGGEGTSMLPDSKLKSWLGRVARGRFVPVDLSGEELGQLCHSVSMRGRRCWRNERSLADRLSRFSLGRVPINAGIGRMSRSWRHLISPP